MDVGDLVDVGLPLRKLATATAGSRDLLRIRGSGHLRCWTRRGGRGGGAAASGRRVGQAPSLTPAAAVPLSPGPAGAGVPTTFPLAATAARALAGGRRGLLLVFVGEHHLH
eukprot:9478366-Pyramimonas_sp.AAC.1